MFRRLATQTRHFRTPLASLAVVFKHSLSVQCTTNHKKHSQWGQLEDTRWSACVSLPLLSRFPEHCRARNGRRTDALLSGVRWELGARARSLARSDETEPAKLSAGRTNERARARARAAVYLYAATGRPGSARSRAPGGHITILSGFPKKSTLLND